MRPITRRLFLSGTALTALSLTLFEISEGQDSGLEAFVRGLAQDLRQRSGTNVLAAAFSAALPATSKAVLEQKLVSRLAGITASSYKERCVIAMAEDFERGNSHKIQGWLMSDFETTLILYAVSH